MNRFEQEYYANMNSIAKSLEKIASALEGNNKKDENITAVTPTGDTIYYKTRRDMYMDNPCTKEEYEAHKANNIPGFEGTLDALDDLCNVKKEQKELNTHHDYLHQLVQDLDSNAYLEFCNAHCLPSNDAVAVTNYITDLDYDEVLGAIQDLEQVPYYIYVSKVGKIRNDSDFEIRQTAKMYEDDFLANGKTKKDCILDYVTENFGPEGARYTDIIKFAYYLGAPNAPKYTSENRGYYSCAFSFRMNGHLIQGGKDYLVKGINDEGKERYFTLSKVNYHTDYWKRIGR